MDPVWRIFRREVAGYFATPLAIVFVAIFVASAGVLTFHAGDFLGRGTADLRPFFAFHPWLYTALVPALAMRLWAEERRLGTVELLFSLPVTVAQAVLGKFLAAWCILAFALVLTFPMWLTVWYLGTPDHGVIAVGYAGSLLLAGAYLAIGSAASALSKSQVMAYLLGAGAGFAFTAMGSPLARSLLADRLSQTLVDAVAAFSFIDRFDAAMRGIADPRDLVFLVSTIALFLFLNAVLVDLGKAT